MFPTDPAIFFFKNKDNFKEYFYLYFTVKVFDSN